jgi:phosphoglycerate-specific signal transduction histidine kinase
MLLQRNKQLQKNLLHQLGLLISMNQAVSLAAGLLNWLHQEF